MRLEKDSKIINPPKRCSGFTLVEVMLSVALLALLASAISTPYISGLKSLNVQADRMLLDSHLRSRMEILVGTDFGSLSSGSEMVTVNGQSFTINWNVVPIDLDGDSNPEPTARQVTVSVAGVSSRTLTTILVNNEGRVGKIS
jgi:prepilin-type N-terminal cleavage/methylation domain-containing protein